jgi:hypothetical protein
VELADSAERCEFDVQFYYFFALRFYDFLTERLLCRLNADVRGLEYRNSTKCIRSGTSQGDV